MDNNKSQGILRGIERPIRQTSEQAPLLPPWLFQHHALADALENAQKVDQKSLINTLNFIHFMGRSLLVLLKHPNYDGSILVRAYPEPSLGEELTCRWSDKSSADLRPEEYIFQHLIIADGHSMTLVPVVLREINNTSFTIQLPSLSYALGHRQAKRYECRNVTAELIQSGFLAKGELMDFSPVAFRVRVRPEISCSFHRFAPDKPVIMHLKCDRRIILSGVFRCIREQGCAAETDIVLKPSDEEPIKTETEHIRNPRQHLSPSPAVIFDHPFLGKQVQFEVSDISTNGLSVYETLGDGVLLRGMVIPKLTICFADLTPLRCAAQVIYRREEKEKGIRCGFAILDMGINDYTRLANMLINALDPNARISQKVDMESLWEFFFKSGFIYPTKYRLIHSYRNKFKETYQKLYQENPELARHFTYEKNGRIYGHMSMVRAYDRTWLIQHHAATFMNQKWPGFMVLKQIIHYLNDMYRLPSAKADYVMCYFRPENKFPDRLFGGFARSLNNPRGCSMDLFTYLPYPTLSLGARLPQGWSLHECSELDLWELNQFYSHVSGGLLLDSVYPGHKDFRDDTFGKTYEELGFLRRLNLYSLKHDRTLNAVFLVDQSDLGLNLSELLNGIKILVVKPESLPWDVLSTAIGQVTPLYEVARVPVLIYPSKYAEAKGIPCEKHYYLWIYDVRFVGQFKKFMKQRMRISYWK